MFFGPQKWERGSVTRRDSVEQNAFRARASFRVLTFAHAAAHRAAVRSIRGKK